MRYWGLLFKSFCLGYSTELASFLTAERLRALNGCQYVLHMTIHSTELQ